MIRQSPIKLTSTFTHRKDKEGLARTMKEKPGKKDTGKGNVKVLNLLKAGLKRTEDKSKSKSRRF